MNKPEKINYNAFTDDQEEAAPPKANLKENLAKKSRFAKDDDAPKKTAVDFDKEVVNHQKNENDIRQRVMELSNKFKSALKDKTLEENKGPIKKDYESEIINQLCDVGLRMNNDQNQPEGLGSIGLSNLLFRAILIQRDMINEQSFQISQMKRVLLDIKKAIEDDENGA
jgi:hypothetical protein